jgi:DNA modification methylase
MEGIEKFINQVICGDALEVLRKMPDESIDLGITSPPYNKKEKHGGWLVDKVRYKGYRDVMPEEEYQSWQVEVLNELYRVIKEGGSFFYNHKVRYEDGKMIHPLQWLMKWGFWQVEERIYWLVKGKPKELKPKHAKLTSIWESIPRYFP